MVWVYLFVLVVWRLLWHKKGQCFISDFAFCSNHFFMFWAGPANCDKRPLAVAAIDALFAPVQRDHICVHKHVCFAVVEAVAV